MGLGWELFRKRRVRSGHASPRDLEVPGGAARFAWTTGKILVPVLLILSGYFASRFATPATGRLIVVGAYLLVASLTVLAALRDPLQHLFKRSTTAVEKDFGVVQYRGGKARSKNADVIDIREAHEMTQASRLFNEVALDSVAEYVKGARVLVTGAAGSIGAEICHQLSLCGPAELIGLDLRPFEAHVVEDLEAATSVKFHIADVRDADRVDTIFAEALPEVVIHAASLENFGFLELNPVEGWKTNVLGTNNVLRAAATHGVGHFLNVSTSKAAMPTCVLGHTHRIAEKLTSWYANRIRGQWVSIRFGQVIGSTGSIMSRFRSQVATGGPITITHPDAVEYLMTADTASRLIIEAGAVGSRGETLVLEMGEPVRLVDVAKRLVANSPLQIEIAFTGLRPGEQLQEAAIADDEPELRNAHPMMSLIPVTPLRPTQLGLFDDSTTQTAMRSLIEISSSDRSTPSN